MPTETGFAGLAIYDPHRLKEADFLAGFVARSDVYEHQLSRLARTAGDGRAQHTLIVGQRGMGKTSLLRRIAIGVGQDPELSGKFLPLTFREEQYNVRSLGQLWQNCGEALAEWLEASGADQAADRLDADMRTTAWTIENAGTTFQETVDEMGRRPVLFLDNLDLILNAIPADEHWLFRKALQSLNGPIVVGTAVQALQQSGDQNAAFYEFFQLELLDPLSPDELIACMRRLAARRGPAGEHVMRIASEHPERLRVIHTLTGGNPRILTLVYKILEQAESESIYADLEILLDQLTPFYKARVEDLRSDLQRAALDAIALNWDPITPTKLSKLTAITSTTLPAQLQRMRETGLIAEVRVSSGRRAYQVAERFFNIWYLMRHGTRRTRQKMRWLTAFLQTFYTSEDLQRMHACLEDVSSPWGSMYAEALRAAIEPERMQARLQQSLATRTANSEAGDDEFFLEALKLVSALKTEDGRKEVERRLAERPKSAMGHWLLGVVLTFQMHLEAAEAAFTRAIELDASFAPAKVALAQCLGRAHRHDEAIALYREALGVSPEDATAWDGLADSLRDAKRYGEAEAAYLKALELDPELKTLRHFAYDGLGHTYAAQSRYDEAQRYFELAAEVSPEDWRRWDYLGDLLVDAGKREAAEAAYRRGIECGADAGWPRHGLARLLNTRGEADAALKLLVEAVQAEPDNARFWLTLGQLQLDFGDTEAGLASLDKAVEISPQAWTWEDRGFALKEHDPVASEAAFRRAIEINPRRAQSWSQLGLLLRSQPSRADEMRDAFEKAIEGDPLSYHGWLGIGMLALTGTVDEGTGEAAIVKACELNPKSHAARSALGLLRARQDRPAEAAAAFEQAIKIAPSDGTHWLRLTYMRMRLADYSAAEQAARRALQLGGVDEQDANLQLVLALLALDRLEEAEQLLPTIEGVSGTCRGAILSMVALSQGQIDVALHRFDEAASSDIGAWNGDALTGLVYAVRHFLRRSAGERLKAWAEERDRSSGVHLFGMVLAAHFESADVFLDLSPEMRAAAEGLYRMVIPDGDDVAPASSTKKARRVRRKMR